MVPKRPRGKCHFHKDCKALLIYQSFGIRKRSVLMLLLFINAFTGLTLSSEIKSNPEALCLCYRVHQMVRPVPRLTCVCRLFVTKPAGRLSWADEHFIDFLTRPRGAAVLCFCPSTFDSYILIMNYCAIMHRRDR